MHKRHTQQVYLHEFNILMDRKVYLPNVSGMLRAYAQGIPAVADNYDFQPFMFKRTRPEILASAWDNPGVLAFSSSMWNHQLNLELARRAHERFPQALIVFGGPHVPTRAEDLLEKYPFVDVAVLSEGEVTFADLLEHNLAGRDFSAVQGVVFRHPDGTIVRTIPRPMTPVDTLPSPYLAGLYDELLANSGDTEYQVILETNRGCPFRCTFCYWGNGESKVRMFDINRLREEINWLSRKQVPYVFGADANFGMFPRDEEIAELFVKAKRDHGYPRAFRVCYGKNATDRIFKVAGLLEGSGLTKGVTVSFQSTDKQTLVNIGRGNIRVDTYRELLQRYRKANIRVYTELILGLPGETYESFSRGIEEVFQAGLYDQIGIFLCQVLPNTEMDEPTYVATHGIKTKRIVLAETHALPRADGEVVEYEDVVVETTSMPLADWKQSATLAWMAQTLHGLKLGFFVGLYLFNRFGIKYTDLFEYVIREGKDAGRFPVFAKELAHFSDYLDALLSGKPQCLFLDEFGKISWQVEEATFLRLSSDLPEFYRELRCMASNILWWRGAEYQKSELDEVFRYQEARMASLDQNKPVSVEFTLNVPEYFDRLLHDDPISILSARQNLYVDRKFWDGQKEEFAKQVIWFGRRDCRALEPAKWTTSA